MAFVIRENLIMNSENYLPISLIINSKLNKVEGSLIILVCIIQDAIFMILCREVKFAVH